MISLPPLLNFKTLYKSYLNCYRRKRCKPYVLEYHIDGEDRLFQLINSINNKTYKISPSTCFGISYPKYREIWAADYIDRIPQTLMVDLLGEYYVPRMIIDSYSCLKGRGTSKAIERAEELIKNCSENYSKDAWILKMDISNYFNEINKDILWGIFEKDLPNDNPLTALFKQIIYNNPTKNAIYKFSEHLEKVPRNKQLRNSKPNCGLPIGNITSQFSGNMYLDDMDHWAVDYGLFGYVRYVDDIFAISPDLELLKSFEKDYKSRVWETRQLTISDSKSKIVNYKAGIDFLGSIILPYRKYMRNFSAKRIFNLLEEIKRKGQTCDYDEIVRYATRCQSYIGHLSQFNEFNLRRRICETCWKYSKGRILFDDKYTKLFCLRL